MTTLPLEAIPMPGLVAPGALRIEREQASPDSYQSTARTAQLMTQYAANSANDPLVQECAPFAVRQWKGGPGTFFARVDPFASRGALAESVFWFVKHYCKFVHHSALILVWLGERDQQQLLIAPDWLVRQNTWRGDCAIYSMLVGALLTVLKVPWELVTLAVDPHQPGVFSHVYPRAILENGWRLALDASHGKHPGWSVPKRDIFRSQVWDSAGNPVDDVGDEFQGLHNYVPARGVTGWAGMGQVEDGTDIGAPPLDFGALSAAEGSDAATAVLTPDMAQIQSSQISSGLQTGNLLPIVAPSDPNYSGMVAALAKAGVQLATIQNLPPGSYYNTATGQIVTGTGTAAASMLSSLSGISPMMWIGIAIGIFALASFSKSR